MNQQEFEKNRAYLRKLENQSDELHELQQRLAKKIAELKSKNENGYEHE